MKPQIFKVCLYYGGEMPNEQRYTPSIRCCEEMGNRGRTRNNRKSK